MKYDPLENIKVTSDELSKKNEEAFKMLITKQHPFYNRDGEDWFPSGKIDLASSLDDMAIEFKNDLSSTIEETIFQVIVTSVKEKRVFNWYGGHTLKDMRCIPSWCIDTRLIALDVADNNLSPSIKNERWKSHFDRLKPIIEDHLRVFPSLEERKEIIKAKNLHAEISDNDFARLKREPDLFLEKDDLLLNTEKWRISTNDREKYNAFYTPQEVVNQVRDLVCKYWKFTQIWDCAAGDGHLVSWYKNILLSDISTAILTHNGFVQNYLHLTSASLSKQPLKDFDKKNGIIIVNPSYRKKDIRYLINFAKNNKLRICIFGPASSFPIAENLPIVDGFFSPGWGNGGSGRKERGQIIVLLDYTGKTDCVSEKKFSDNTIFECIPGDDAIRTERGYFRYGCTASDSIYVAKETNINMFATVSRNKKIVGQFLSKKINNYFTDHNGKGGNHGYGKWTRKIVKCDICKGKRYVDNCVCTECEGKGEIPKSLVKKRSKEISTKQISTKQISTKQISTKQIQQVEGKCMEAFNRSEELY